MDSFPQLRASLSCPSPGNVLILKGLSSSTSGDTSEIQLLEDISRENKGRDTCCSYLENEKGGMNNGGKKNNRQISNITSTTGTWSFIFPFSFPPFHSPKVITFVPGCCRFAETRLVASRVFRAASAAPGLLWAVTRVPSRECRRRRSLRRRRRRRHARSLANIYHPGVCEKTLLPRRRPLGKLAWQHQIRGWRAVFAVGLHGQDLLKRSVSSQTPACHRVASYHAVRCPIILPLSHYIMIYYTMPCYIILYGIILYYVILVCDVIT